MIRQIPNLLTILRFLMVPVFLFYLFVSVAENSILIALIIFVVASLTDYLDGMLARKLKVISDFGKIMDPLADKALVISALAGLCWLPPFHISLVVFVIIVAREICITMLRELYQRKGIVVAADKLGKLKTVMQMAGVIAALALWAFIDPISPRLHFIIDFWFWLVAAITLISGMNYFIILFKKEPANA